MRRTRGRKTVSQERTTTALRRQVDKDDDDDDDVSSGSQLIEEEMEEDEALSDQKKLSSSRLLQSSSSSREKRRRERETQSKPKEMTEKEMVDLALRLSEQEASMAAVKLQQEEDAVMKAIEESMVSEMQPSSQPESQGLHADADASVPLASQRGIFRLNRKTAPLSNKGAAGSSVTSETNLNRAPMGTEDENRCQNKKRKREDGSLETMDFCQTQKLCKQPSPDRTEPVSVPLDSPQSSDSTQLDDSQLPKSLVFQEESCRAEVRVRRLTPDLLETYKRSGFVSCSQDSWTSTQRTQPKSPTFPKSPARASNQAWSKSTALPDSPLLSEGDPGDDVEMEPGPEYIKSPTFGRSSPDERLPNTDKPQDGVCHTACENSGFTFCSQDSLTSPVRSTACRLRSPVFPSSPEFSKNRSPHASPAFLKIPVPQKQGQKLKPSTSASRTGQKQKIAGVCNTDASSDVELGDPASDEDSSSRSHPGPTGSYGPPQSLKANGKTDRSPDDLCNRRHVPSTSDEEEEEEENETGKDWSSGGQVMTSNMTLSWSDEDDDVTVVDSPSPVFPEEKHVHQDAQTSPETNCRLNPHSCDPVISSKDDPVTVDQKGSDQRVAPPSSSMSTYIPDPELQPGSGRVPVGAPGTSAGQTTVHYYWGVPFCPRGLDPNAYTQVIVAQLEVYEKSVKRARRSLLRKAEWGEPVLPQAEKFPSPRSPAESPPQQISRRQGLRLRGKKPPKAAATPPPEPEEEEEARGQDTDDCGVCPETPQLSEKDGDSTPELTVVADAGEEIQPESPELPRILSGDSAGCEEALQEDMEVDAGVAGREPEENVPVDGSVRGEEAEEEGRSPEVEELKDGGGQRSASPEVEAAAAPQSPEPVVDCPICQRSFHFTQIEMHAAYCDGEVASTAAETRPEPDCFQVSIKPRRVRTKRADEESRAHSSKGNKTSQNLEKCYICQKTVSLSEYSRHTELCIRRCSAKTKGNLLSALEQTESRDAEAGPSRSRLQSGEVIDLRDEDVSVSGFRISSSPIRTFTAISEASDCLIDFKNQHRVKRSNRRRR